MNEEELTVSQRGLLRGMQDARMILDGNPVRSMAQFHPGGMPDIKPTSRNDRLVWLSAYAAGLKTALALCGGRVNADGEAAAS